MSMMNKEFMMKLRAGMPIHSHLSQKDPQKVGKVVKKAIDNGEGCQVSKFLMAFNLYSLALTSGIVFACP